jgi:hypothetical protein
MFLSILRDAVRANVSLVPTVARVLEHLAVQEAVPSSLVGECYSFDDRLCLAAEGIHGELDDVAADLRAFLETQSEPFELR